MVRRTAISMTPPTNFGLFAVTLFLSELPSISPSLYLSELPLLQFITEHGQMLGVATACGRFFGGSSYCPFTVHFVPKTGYIRWNGLKQAKRLTVRIDS